MYAHIGYDVLYTVMLPLLLCVYELHVSSVWMNPGGASYLYVLHQIFLLSYQDGYGVFSSDFYVLMRIYM